MLDISMPVAMLLVGYLLGSIPFALIVTRLGGAGDLRAIGSGNIGATNVLRTGRRELAALTLLLDMGKGAAAVLLARTVAPQCAAIAAAAAFFGHLYPVWLGFRGGKGLATFLGIALAMDWRLGLMVAIVWLGGAMITRVSSMGSMLSAMAAPVAAAIMQRFDLALLFLALAVMVLWKHRGNIARLLAGTEPRIGAK
jgi:acyl phosphate:glycerol-3-phosphate acyltransferase